MGLRFVGLVLLALFVSTDAQAERVKLRVGTLAIDGSRYMQDILALGKEIEVRTRRGVRIDWISGGQLGDERAMAAQITKGTLDGGGFSETGLIALVPEMAAWQYAGLFDDYAAVDRASAAVSSDVRERFAKQGLTFAMWADLGFAHLFSTEPITSIGDVLQRAAPQLALPIDTELTTAITSKRARAWALPPLYAVAIGTPARHMTELRYRYVVGGLVFSKAGWAKLSAAQQAIVLEVCREFEPKIRASWRAETDRGIAALRKSGVRVKVFGAAEVAAFVEASARARQNHARGAVAELVTKIVASMVGAARAHPSTSPPTSTSGIRLPSLLVRSARAHPSTSPPTSTSGIRLTSLLLAR